MPFSFVLNQSIPPTARLVFPVSMNQRYHTGERLAALVEFASQHNSTLLIADGLQSHNFGGNTKKAIKQGNNFLEKNKSLFDGVMVIENPEQWDQRKNEKTVKIVRWQVWEQIVGEKLREAKRLVDEEYDKQGDFFSEIRGTAKNSFSAVSVESSIAYQKEEIAYFLTFNDFDFHIYPRELNPSQSLAKKIFRDRCTPDFITPVFKEKFIYSKTANGLFTENKKKRHENSLPLAARIVLNNLEELFKSSEMSPAHKNTLRNKLKEIAYEEEVSLPGPHHCNP